MIDHNNLIAGKSQSCGCLSNEATRQRLLMHGLSHTSLYRTWRGMLNRCYKPQERSYEYYGGRGIDVCPQWRESFLQFCTDVGEKPFPEATLDRIDNDRGYWPDNVRWATSSIQSHNKRTTRFLTYQGKTATMTDWAREYGLLWDTLRSRLRLGWSVEEALTRPIIQNPVLTDEKVRMIRAMFDNGQTPAQLARHFQVAPRTIRDVINRCSWKHVEGDAS